MKRGGFLTHEQQNVIRVIFGFFLALCIIFTVFIVKNVIQKAGFIAGFAVGFIPFGLLMFIAMANIVAWKCKMRW